MQSYFEIGKNKSRHHQKNQRLRRQKQKNKIFLSLHTKEDYIDYINTKKNEKQAQINNALKGLESGIKIIIDCSYENSMKKKEINSLCTQICLICAQMKRVETPLCINLTKINPETLENLKKIGISNWAINVFSEDFLDIEIFKTRKHDLIYLTPDSENIIENIEMAVYKVRDKNETKEEAKAGVSKEKIIKIKESKESKIYSENSLIAIFGIEFEKMKLKEDIF